MKIAIFGTGAMGSIYAGKLAAAGNEVWAIDCWEAHLDEIKNNCLVIKTHFWLLKAFFGYSLVYSAALESKRAGGKRAMEQREQRGRE